MFTAPNAAFFGQGTTFFPTPFFPGAFAGLGHTGYGANSGTGFGATTTPSFGVTPQFGYAPAHTPTNINGLTWNQPAWNYQATGFETTPNAVNAFNTPTFNAGYAPYSYAQPWYPSAFGSPWSTTAPSYPTPFNTTTPYGVPFNTLWGTATPGPFSTPNFSPAYGFSNWNPSFTQTPWSQNGFGGSQPLTYPQTGFGSVPWASTNIFNPSTSPWFGPSFGGSYSTPSFSNYPTSTNGFSNGLSNPWFGWNGAFGTFPNAAWFPVPSFAPVNGFTAQTTPTINAVGIPGTTTSRPGDSRESTATGNRGIPFNREAA